MDSSRRDARPSLTVGLAVVALVALFVATAFFSRAGSAGVADHLAASSTSPCQFQKAQEPTRVAFCDTFDKAASSNATRSGALNPTVWGVSQIQAGGGDRYDTGNSTSAGTGDDVAPVAADDSCGGTVVPPQNIQICNGQLFDSVNDDGGQTVLAMYPRQPFDIAGRTGDVTFDVSDNSEGDHAAWPAFAYTDQPVPTPYESASGIDTSGRNSFGITFAQQCDQPSNEDCATTQSCPETNDVSVDTMYETVSSKLESVPFTLVGCVAKSTNPTQQNHVEIQLSATGATVWASDPGSSSLVELATATFDMPLTRGLLWMEDSHYNGDKFNNQQSDTFGWDNFGFDGPILPRDLGFDVPDRGLTASDGSESLGWATGSGSASPVTVHTVSGVTSRNLDDASGALLEFTWYAFDASVPSITLNGHAITAMSWPFDSTTYVWRTIAYQVPLSDVVTGSNSIEFQDAPGGFANVDLILQGAGGVPTCLDPSSCGTTVSTGSTGSVGSTGSGTPTPTPHPTASASPTPSPSATATATSTPAPSPQPSTRLHHRSCAIREHHRLVWGSCDGTFVP